MPLIFAVIFLIIPLVRIAKLSFTSGGAEGSGSGFASQLSSPVVRETLWRTFAFSCGVTALCLVLAFPIAYILTTTASKMIRTAIIVCVVAQLFVSVVVRSFGWVILLSNGGPVQRVLDFVGLGNVGLLYNSGAAVVGMVQTLLALMLLPIWASLRGLPRNLIPAARVLGSRGHTVFFRVIWPLVIPGVFGGVVIVFASSMSGYVQPLLLGGPVSGLWASVLVTNDVTINNDPSAAAVLSMLYLAIMVVCLVALGAAERRFDGVRRADARLRKRRSRTLPVQAGEEIVR